MATRVTSMLWGSVGLLVVALVLLSPLEAMAKPAGCVVTVTTRSGTGGYVTVTSRSTGRSATASFRAGALESEVVGAIAFASAQAGVMTESVPLAFAVRVYGADLRVYGANTAYQEFAAIVDPAPPRSCKPGGAPCGGDGECCSGTCSRFYFTYSCN